MAPPVEKSPESALPNQLKLDLNPSAALEVTVRNFNDVYRVLGPVLSGKKGEGSAEYEFIRSKIGGGDFEKGKKLLTNYLSSAIDFIYRKAQDEGSTKDLEGNRPLRDILTNLRRRTPDFEFLRELESKLVQLTSGEALPERVVGTAAARTTLFSDLPPHVEIRETLGSSSGTRYDIARGEVTSEIRGLTGGNEPLAKSLVDNTATLLTAELNHEPDQSVGCKELADSFKALRKALGGTSDYDDLIALLDANKRKEAIDAIKKDTTLESLLKATKKTLAVKFTDQAAVVFTANAEIVFDVSKMDARTKAKWLGDVRARMSIIYAYLVGGGFLREGELNPSGGVQNETPTPLVGSGHAFIARPGLEFSWRPVRILITMDVGYRQMTLEKPDGVVIPPALEASFKQEGWYIGIPRIEAQMYNQVREYARFVFTRAGLGGLGSSVEFTNGTVVTDGPKGVTGWVGFGGQWGYHLIKNSKGSEVGTFTADTELVVGAGALLSKGLATIEQIAKGQFDPESFGSRVTAIVNAELNTYFRISSPAAGNFLVGPAFKYQANIVDPTGKKDTTYSLEGVVQFNYTPPVRKGWLKSMTFSGTVGGRGEIGPDALPASARVGVGMSIHFDPPEKLVPTKLVPSNDKSNTVRNRAQDLAELVTGIQRQLDEPLPMVDALAASLLRSISTEKFKAVPRVADSPEYKTALEKLAQAATAKDQSEIPHVPEGTEPPPAEPTKQSLLNEALQELNRLVAKMRRNPLG